MSQMKKKKKIKQQGEYKGDIVKNIETKKKKKSNIYNYNWHYIAYRTYNSIMFCIKR